MNRLRKLGVYCPRLSRHLLSKAFACEESWEQRLSSPVLSKVNAEELNNQLMKQLQSLGKISPVDFDIYVNKVTNESLLDDAEILIHRFRRSPSTAFALPSSEHAVIRAFLKFNKTEMLMKMLDDRLGYGIFLDSYTASLLMDTFLESENYRDACKCAIQLMLQEDFGSEMSKAFSLYSCWMYLLHLKPEPWDPLPKPVIPEPVEEVKIRVDYVREPFFDDHFDLTDQNHLIGKTLSCASLTRHDSLGISLKMLGWTMYNKSEQVIKCLQETVSKKTPIFVEVLQKVTEIISSSDSVEKDEILALLEQIKESNLLVEDNVEAVLRNELQDAIQKCEKLQTEEMLQLYKQWNQQRESLLEEQVMTIKRLEKLKEIEEKKKLLMEKEDELFFFENEDKWLLQAEKNEELLKDLMKKIPKYERKKMEKQEDNYTPPEMPTNR